MKVYMMTDIEGVSGLRHIDEAQTGSDKWQAARKLLCGDVNAAIEGAFDGGADEVVVRDGHGGGFNFILDLMDPRALYTGPGGPHWCPGLDETADLGFFIGAHAKAGTQNAFLEHTQSSKAWYRYTVNGREFGEQGQFGAYCSAFGVPVGLVTGDQAACDEAKDFFPHSETVAVKFATGRNSCIIIHPTKTHEMIRAAAKKAVERAGEMAPLDITWPAEIVMNYMRSDSADSMAAKHGVERVDARTVKWTAANFLEIML